VAYDCSNFGQRGNFSVTPVNGGVYVGEIAVNQLGEDGKGTEHYHGASGTRYIQISTVCNWVVEAVSL
jgi:hypothetical protein